MQIEFNLPHVFRSGSDQTENAIVLRALLECLIDINRAYLRIRPETPILYNSGVRYGRTTWWECIPALYSRGLGDCKSLTAALVAEYIEKGIPAKPVFRFRQNEYGGTDYHILVQTRQGFEDPSKVLGMGQDENAWFR